MNKRWIVAGAVVIGVLGAGGTPAHAGWLTFLAAADADDQARQANESLSRLETKLSPLNDRTPVVLSLPWTPGPRSKSRMLDLLVAIRQYKCALNRNYRYGIVSDTEKRVLDCASWYQDAFSVDYANRAKKK